MNKQISTEFSIRRWFAFEDEVLATENGRPADGEPLRKIVVGACIKNPCATQDFTADLSAFVKFSPTLASELGRRLLKKLEGQQIASYGKACVVGTAGEYEHGNAFLTAEMMDPLRKILGGGLSWVPSTGKRGGPGTSIDIPLAHKDALYVRSHYDTVTVNFPDGPNPDEVLVLIAVATRGRLHARLGGLQESDVNGLDGLR
jgi:hypothetical protein